MLGGRGGVKFLRSGRSVICLLALGLVAGSLVACSSEKSVPVDEPRLVTAAPNEPDAGTFDSAWTAVLDEDGGCVIATAGEYRSVLVAPSGSSMVRIADGEIALDVDGAEHPLGHEYAGGGFVIESDVDEAAKKFDGAAECLESTGADTLLVIYDIDS